MMLAAALNGFTVPVIVCLILGIALLIFEMFIPGFHFTGILGLILLVVAIILSADTFINALITTAVVLVIVGVSLLVFIRSASKGRLSKSKLVLKEVNVSRVIPRETRDVNSLLGKKGTALTLLRSAGKAEFEGERLDVVTDGEFVEKGTTVYVTQVKGRRIVVSSSDPEKTEN